MQDSVRQWAEEIVKTPGLGLDMADALWMLCTGASISLSPRRTSIDVTGVVNEVMRVYGRQEVLEIIEYFRQHDPASPLDLAVGLRRQSFGITLVSNNNKVFLRIMRTEAVRLARIVGYVSTDELREYARDICIKPKHENAWGAIFRAGKTWKKVGHKKSAFVTNNAREIKVWSLVQ